MNNFMLFLDYIYNLFFISCNNKKSIQQHDVDNYKYPPFEKVKLHRQYTICCEEDYDNILYGFCPEYALAWDHETNKKYWDEGHDYLAGWSNEDIDNSNKNIKYLMWLSNNGGSGKTL